MISVGLEGGCGVKRTSRKSLWGRHLSNARNFVVRASVEVSRNLSFVDVVFIIDSVSIEPPSATSSLSIVISSGFCTEAGS